MINFRNSDKQYGLVSMFLHWFMALLIFGLLGLGLYMVELSVSLQKLKLYGWHKELGMLVLILAFVRMVWRWINIVPVLPSEVPYVQKISARLVHILFYGFMIFVPISGWLISSAAGLPTSFFGLFIFPDLIGPSKALMSIFIEIHKWLSYTLIATIIIHMSAAFLHHLYYKDDVMRRMLP